MNIFRNLVIIALSTVFALSACAKKDYLVTIKTSYGDMKVILYDETPEHKANFLKLAENGDYDSTIFHRIIDGFMIQGGDVNAKPDSENKIDYTIPAEFVKSLFHHKGALAAARQGDQMNPEKKSSGCQWYIVQGIVYDKEQLTTDVQKLNQSLRDLMQVPGYENLQQELSMIYYEQGEKAFNEKMMELKPVCEQEFNVKFDKDFPPDRLEAYTTVGGTPHLDDAYTVFGRVVEGMEVIDKIAAVQTGERDKPVEDIFMTMEVKAMNPKKLQKLYGEK